MKMSDKDFDQLFNAKLANMEAEPSPMVWDNITAELDGPAKKRKSVIPFLRIAATIVVLMGVSLFFLRPEVKTVALHPSGDAAQLASNPVETTNGSAAAPVNGKVEDSSDQAAPAVKRTQIASAEASVKEVKNAVDTTQILAEVNRKLAADNAADIALQQQNAQLAIANNNVVSQPNTANTDKQAIIANNTPAQKGTETVRKKRIHSLGDLLNVVIAQVDKRKDKVVEFTNDRDDDSFNITGLNLGVVRAKKDN